MTQQSRIYFRTGQYRRMVVAFSLLVFLSATIVALALRGVTETCAPVSLTVKSVLHYVTCEAEKVHVWELARHQWELASRRITEIQKDGRMSGLVGYFRTTGARLQCVLKYAARCFPA
jgi:hypothetical protein